MRVPAAFEISLLARIISRAAPKDRKALAVSILAEAEHAHDHLRKTGRAHPAFGDGSLMTRCNLLSPPPEPLGNDREFLACLALAAHAVLFHSAV
jgi:hypothetical protein